MREASKITESASCLVLFRAENWHDLGVSKPMAEIWVIDLHMDCLYDTLIPTDKPKNSDNGVIWWVPLMVLESPLDIFSEVS